MDKNSYISGSGNRFKVSDLFSGKNDKINIPDLQRDYCWSAKADLVENFLDNLIELFKKYNPDSTASDRIDCDVPLGLIYGYFDEYADNHLQLCDGQQRLTTLFLLIGEINRRLPENHCAQWLMSDFEKNEDDHEPYLRYEIRESSLSFLSELTYGYFIKNESAPEQPGNIESLPWFINEYNYDPTAKNILGAIKIISDKLDKNNMSVAELSRFVDFVVNIPFIFVDMESRQKGEETFVIINTTGESLTGPQNLKPLVINEVSTDESQERHDAAKKWEEMESWFWKNRGGDETNDNGMIAFLYLLSIYKALDHNIAYDRMTTETFEFPYKEIPFDEIYSAFKAYKRIYHVLTRSSGQNYPFSAKEVYKALPLLAYLERFPLASDQQLARESHMFSNIIRYRNVDNDRKDKFVPAYASATTVRNRQSSPDVLSLIEVWASSQAPYAIEESSKLRFISLFKDDEYIRQYVENIIYSLENLPLFNGRISSVLEWANGDLQALEQIFEKIKLIFSNETNIDHFRRAMLARGIIPKHNVNVLWYDCEDLRRLIESNISLALHCINNVNCLDVSASLLSDAREYYDTSNPLYCIIKDDNLLYKSESKRFRNIGNGVVFLLQKERVSANYWILHGYEIIEGRPDDFYSRIWNWGNGLFMDANNYNIRIHCDLADSTIGVNWTVLTDRAPVCPEAKELINSYIKDKKFASEELLQGFKDYWQFVKRVLLSVKCKEIEQQVLV